MFITGAPDNIKQWKCPNGDFMQNMSGHNAVVNTLAINSDDVLFSGGARRASPGGARCGQATKQMLALDGLCVPPAPFFAGDNGSMCFWDVKSATCFQRRETIVQPGSLDSEMGIFASTFDKSGSRLITCEADKTIKVWRVRAASARWPLGHLPRMAHALVCVWRGRGNSGGRDGRPAT